MIFITQGRYTREAMAGMVANPEDRAKETRRIVEAAGGKHVASYFTFGEFDFMDIVEFDDVGAVTPVLIAAAAGGSLAELRTTIAMPWDEAREDFATARKLAKSFRSAGGGKK